MKNITGIILLTFITALVLNTGCNLKRNPATPDLTPVIIPGISTPVPTQTVSSGCTLPDLTITGIAQGFSGVTLGCVENYSHPGYIIYLKNQGCVGVTGAVSLNVNGVLINYAFNGGLVPGETENVWVENAPASGSMTSASVDPLNSIAESDETNNSFQTYVLTLTPPPLCTLQATNTPVNTIHAPTFTATVTLTPLTPTVTRTPTATPTGSQTTGMPDLIVLSAVTQLEFPHACLNGDEGNVGTRVVIKNIGSGSAVGFVDISMQGHGTQQVTGAMSAGAERTVFFSGTSWPNNSVITVDSSSNIAESNESNNVFNSPVAICTPPPACTAQTSVTPTVTHTPTITLTVPPEGLPDLIITSNWGNCTFAFPIAQCYEVYPALGTEVFIKNQGLATASAFKVKIGVTETSVPGLAPGVAAQVWIDTCTPMGDFTITIDPDGTVTESNENNNTFAGSHGAMPTAPPTCNPSVSVSPTVTFTPTVTATLGCLSHKIKPLNGVYLLGSNMYFMGSASPSVTALRFAVYNEADSLVRTINVSTFTGTTAVFSCTAEALGTWHAAVMDDNYAPPAVFNEDDPGFADTCEVVVAQIVPTPTTTPGIMNYVKIYHGQAMSAEMYNYKLNSCNSFTIAYIYCTQQGRLALYDAGGNLLKTELMPCSDVLQKMYYKITGNEVPGMWHIDLYRESDNVPSIRTSGGTLQINNINMLNVE